MLTVTAAARGVDSDGRLLGQITDASVLSGLAVRMGREIAASVRPLPAPSGAMRRDPDALSGNRAGQSGPRPDWCRDDGYVWDNGRCICAADGYAWQNGAAR